MPKYWIFAIMVLLSLGACAPSGPTADWSGYVSKTETLRFVAAASCIVPYPFNPVANDAPFFPVTDLRPVAGRLWSFDISYLTAGGPRRDRFDITQWWNRQDIKQWSAAADTRTLPQDAEQRQCGVLVDIPKAKNADRPYYLDNEQAKAAEHDAAVYMEQTVSYVLCAVFIVVLMPSFFGFEDGRAVPAEGQWLIALTAAIGVGVVSLIVADVYVEAPWRNFEKARAYYAWFSELPRARSGFLLPIPPQYLYFLLAAPPHPTATQISVDPYLWVTAVLAGLWLVVMLPAAIRGAYWLVVPLPLEKSFYRAVREGRALTAEEIILAVNKAIAGKRGWRLRMMRRKAEAFARSLGCGEPNI